jgi:hypothetical protein
MLIKARVITIPLKCGIYYKIIYSVTMMFLGIMLVMLCLAVIFINLLSVVLLHDMIFTINNYMYTPSNIIFTFVVTFMTIAIDILCIAWVCDYFNIYFDCIHEVDANGKKV